MSGFEHPIFAGEGDMRQLFRQTRWESTAIGAYENWSEVLKVSVALCLNSRFPLILWWGPELCMLYNDSYVGHLRGKHPKALATPGKHVWTEIWETIGPMLEGVFSTGSATYSTDMQLFLERNGYSEETYHTFSYSAVKDVTGKIVGIFTPVNETTERVIGERRLKTISELSRTKENSEGELLQSVNKVLQNNFMDLPLCAFYSVNVESEICEVLAHNAESDLTKAYLSGESLVADLLACAKSRIPKTIEELNAAPDVLPKSRLGVASKQAVIMPISTYSDKESLLLFAALSPHQQLDDNAMAFFESVGRSIATILKDARAYQHEKRRAEALEQLDRAKTVFFNNVSHEFRTPITLMIGPLEKLLTRNFEIDDHADLEIVHRNALRLLKLVNGLLDFSRIEAGRYNARFEQTDLNSFVLEIASLFRSTIENEGLSFEVNVGQAKNKAYVDREMLETIILNLLSNAFKFTRVGKISVNLSEADDNFVLSVSDTGIGIPANELPNVFKRFYRLKCDGARTFEGTGIGLAMVNELVQLHGGSVALDSLPNHGSTFAVRIPCGFRHLPADQVIQENQDKLEIKNGAAYLLEAAGWRSHSVRLPATGEEKLVDSSQSIRLLVADDNADMREYLVRLLSPLWSVTAVSSGKQALEVLESESVDLVIADIMMPDMDGFELLNAIRNSQKFKNIQILLLSARAGNEARAEGIEKGANDYLVKPFSSRELCARVASLLQQKVIAESLEEAVQQRTIELESALESKSRFLATVSHEVRTPMAGVMGLIELIGKSSLEKEVQQLAEIALESSQRLLRILNDLLDASKLDAGKISLENRNFAVRSVIGDAVQLVRTEADRKMITVSSSVSSDVPELVCGDELRVRQILLNLMFNAVKFTHKGSVQVKVALSRKTEAEATLRFTVQDTGIGISADQHSKLFRPYEQLQKSTSRIYGGTGLGLSICQTLTELLHGEIGVESEPGKGSTFWVEIPFRADACQI